jgi:hypothetical protein
MNASHDSLPERHDFQSAEPPTKENFVMPFLVATDRAAREEIQHRAYFMWLDRGQPKGLELEHWLAAESEVTPVKSARVVANRSDGPHASLR